jgi:hypothetical protein
MTTVTQETPRAGAATTSTAFRTFATVFAIAAPVIYTLCEMRNWPLFTYHPGTNDVNLGWAPAVRDQGPAMHWYGWTATTLIASGVLGVLATFLPQHIVRKIPLSLVWIVPLAMVPILIYALRFFWRW